jgi:prepilin-type N-terminal cleavage/methylation domain-containing protein
MLDTLGESAQTLGNEVHRPPGCADTVQHRRSRSRRNARGFSFIELLVAFVVLGILAAIAMNLTKTRARAYLAVLQSDLRNLGTAQEAYFAEHDKYADGDTVNFTPSAGVTLENAASGGKGWSARVQHAERADVWCAVFFGNPDMIFPPAQVMGVITCGPPTP